MGLTLLDDEEKSQCTLRLNARRLLWAFSPRISLSRPSTLAQSSVVNSYSKCAWTIGMMRMTAGEKTAFGVRGRCAKKGEASVACARRATTSL